MVYDWFWTCCGLRPTGIRAFLTMIDISRPAIKAASYEKGKVGQGK